MDRILLVEDDPAILRGLRDNLTGQAYDVLTASDGETGYRLILEHNPDLILLDLMLPDISGLDLCRRVRDEGLTTPIVMLTAQDLDSDRVRGLDVGADDYVTKPFSLNELLARIRGILRHRRDWRGERQEFDGDLRSAAKVQQALLPHAGPVVDTLDYAGFCEPARAVGGDYYDFLDLGSGLLALLVADVSGKGVAAALTMASLHAMIRNQAVRFGDRCDELAVHINASLSGTTEASRYATLFYAVYDSAQRTLTYINAGHPAPLLVRGGSAPAPPDVVDLGSSAPPVGMFPVMSVVRAHEQLLCGDWLIIFSDGVSEAMNPRNEEFGRERVLEVVRRNHGLRAASMRDVIRKEVIRHATGCRQSDDLTLIVGKVL